MATTRTFNDMLNEYLPNELLMEELIKRDYILQKITKDEAWKGGDLIVPFRGAHASSVKFGGLTTEADIAQSKYVRGKIDAYKEVWGSLIFNETDLVQHDGKIPESTFLRVLPDEIEYFMDYFKEVVSIQMTSGPHFAVVEDDTDRATGVMVVDRVDRLAIDQKCNIDDDDSAPLDVYVIAINLNTKAVTFSATRGGAFVDLTAYTSAANAKVYHDGVDTTGATSFISLRQALLSLANGGDASLHGVTKLAYPYLQAYNHDGSAISATNILEKLFDAFVEHRIRARGKASTFVMSFKNWGSVMKSQQVEKGQYKMVNDTKRSEFGWWETMIASTTTGESLEIAAVQEMPDDVIYALDWKSMSFRSNGGFRRRVSPDGDSYYEVRNTSGYQYVVDAALYGEFEHTKPANNMVIHSISY